MSSDSNLIDCEVSSADAGVKAAKGVAIAMSRSTRKVVVNSFFLFFKVFHRK